VFESPVRRGPAPRYCTAAHRQAAHRARHPANPSEAAVNSPAVDALLDELEQVFATPGEEAMYATMAVARDLLEASGRALPDEPHDPAGRRLDVEPRRRRPPKWSGTPLAAPASRTPRIYQRVWDDDWGYQVVVRAADRHGQPTGGANPLWLRRHRASEDPDWRTRYDIRDRWAVPDSNALHRLALDLIADAIDAERRSAFGSWNKAPYIARHFTGDVIERQLRAGSWAISRDEILRWLDLHGYVQPVT